MTKDTTAPAFGSGSPEQGGHPGMSLREYYAGQALMGLGTWVPNYPSPYTFDPKEARAKYAVAQADAMIAALKEQKP